MAFPKSPFPAQVVSAVKGMLTNWPRNQLGGLRLSFNKGSDYMGHFKHDMIGCPPKLVDTLNIAGNDQNLNNSFIGF